ncbi:hypothetical protein CDEST_11916 [Colletotrichum destructivum]|uniref:Secreted protein n=1 Tax=Colletotrichum destructivum TaxID=34406 RepID=A0AAX4IUL7_9PEZI|nr:hypothetical protein CDEST_11916 [Colletotrichum destructivum]
MTWVRRLALFIASIASPSAASTVTCNTRECHRQNKPSSNLPSHSGFSRVFASARVSFLCRVLRCTLERTGITSLKRGKGKRRAPSGFCSVVFVQRLGPAARENRTIIVHAHLFFLHGRGSRRTDIFVAS